MHDKGITHESRCLRYARLKTVEVVDIPRRSANYSLMRSEINLAQFSGKSQDGNVDKKDRFLPPFWGENGQIASLCGCLHGFALHQMGDHLPLKGQTAAERIDNKAGSSIVP